MTDKTNERPPRPPSTAQADAGSTKPRPSMKTDERLITRSIIGSGARRSRRG